MYEISKTKAVSFVLSQVLNDGLSRRGIRSSVRQYYFEFPSWKDGRILCMAYAKRGAGVKQEQSELPPPTRVRETVHLQTESNQQKKEWVIQMAHLGHGTLAEHSSLVADLGAPQAEDGEYEAWRMEGTRLVDQRAQIDGPRESYWD
ncbi:hypothetical protein DPX16_15717 [Anabarilius grahami]|uniref:Uncharacterized protein n=1 Tax=Anabarilius grahami TaxID=495550 RepID=A0A3N0YU15_ANAGA|nr:hypothetical protein DPX16_15717 [Anabarilius grahami]